MESKMFFDYLIGSLAERPKTLGELMKETGLRRRELRQMLMDMKAIGYDIRRENGKYYLGSIAGGLENVFELNIPERGVFAIVSDTHLGSKKARLDLLSEFYDWAYREGARVFLHAGDITDGMGVYKGQLYELQIVGVDNQIEYVVENYPGFDDATTYFITGNHDLKSWDRDGVDIGNMIEQQRADLVYLGQYRARIVTPQRVKIDLLHPGGGQAYALSYKPQKYIERIRSGQKPNILIWGHHHDLLYLFYRNVHLIKAGTFQDQTDYMLRKGLQANLGAWLVEYSFSDGEVDWIKMWLKAYFD